MSILLLDLILLIWMATLSWSISIASWEKRDWLLSITAGAFASLSVVVVLVEGHLHGIGFMAYVPLLPLIASPVEVLLHIFRHYMWETLAIRIVVVGVWIGIQQLRRRYQDASPVGAFVLWKWRNYVGGGCLLMPLVSVQLIGIFLVLDTLFERWRRSACSGSAVSISVSS